MSRAIGMRTMALAGAAMCALAAFGATNVITDDKPGTDWESTWYPVGNGSLGAMVDGGRERLRIQFNVDSLWTGDENVSSDTDDAGADANYERMGAYQNFGELTVTMPPTRVTEPYLRSLDLARGVYEDAFGEFKRTVFASREEDCIVIHVDRKGDGPLALGLEMRGAHGEKAADGGFSGRLPNGLEYAAKAIVRGNTVILKAKTGTRDISFGDTDFDRLLARHAKEYAGYWNRCSLELPEDEAAAQLFAFGRYLLISSSRPGTLPANLQGVWNDSNEPAWSCDYHTNINLQMNYWGADVANLSDCFTPLSDWMIRTLPVVTAGTRAAFPKSRGFAYRTSANAVGGGGWRWNFAGAPWLAAQLYDHYLFTRDETYLRETAWPLMKGAAEFLISTQLRERADGTVVVKDGWSPEHGPREDGVAHDQQIVRELFRSILAAAKTLNVDDGFVREVARLEPKLRGEKVGSWGQLQEWEADRDRKGDDHPHTSQLFAVYPGTTISRRATPELAKAAAVALDGRAVTGYCRRSWTWAWRTALWARLGDGEQAVRMINEFFRWNLYSNRFAIHPPFQIDGNLGIVAGIAEMLLQSHECDEKGRVVIRLLPALPKAWKSGQVRGFRARGGYTVSFAWKDGGVVSHSVTGGDPAGYVLEGAGDDQTAFESSKTGLPGVRAEFDRYFRQITGRDPPEGLLQLNISTNVSATGNDAYSIRTTPQGVAVTGSNLRSVYYGVYDLLERRGGCHWFWDGDVVPKRDSLDFSNLDVREEARFAYRAIRYFAHRGLTRFQAEHWGPEDWKREIDWCLKRRLNVFMLRIGQDDLFQRAFPETCAYPDPATDLPGHGEGYDNRTLFWSLQFRGRLRRDVQRYAFDRGLEVPEDFGTMTHWYSRTPEDFLAKMNPPFIPQATEGYAEKNGLVWDIRDDKWVDAYWKMTRTAVRDYGRPGLLHTIGLGERLCYTNRADNLKLKLLALEKFLKRAHRDYPDSKVLIAGWDLYFTWYPEEVQALVRTLDPQRDIIWDYEGDATVDYRDEMAGKLNNFTKWDVVGKFPYTYSIFLAFEEALDIRANYPLIERRQRIVQNDPMCKGYLLWPEASHTDTLALRYFTANAWSREAQGIDRVLPEFCASRYGSDAARWQKLWEKAIPASYLMDWAFNYPKKIVRCWDDLDDAGLWTSNSIPAALAGAGDFFRDLADLDWKKSSFTERDAIDLARTVGDRMTVAARDRLLRAYHLCQTGGGALDEVRGKAAALKAFGRLMADVLALHTDYSLAESYDRLNGVERISNPNFSKVLVENAICGYCFSHQYEAAAYWYRPYIDEFADEFVRRAQCGDRSKIAFPALEQYRDARMYAKPLDEMRPTLPRTQESFRQTMLGLAEAADAVLKSCSPM